MAKIIKGKNPRKPYTVRYWQQGRQRERSFKTWREADGFRVRFEHESREHSYIDPRAGAEPFSESMTRWVDRHPGAPRTLQLYRSVVRNHLEPALGDRKLRDVAADREAAERLLLVTLPGKGLSRSMVVSARNVIAATCTAEVRAGKIPAHRLTGIRIPAAGSTRAEFHDPTHAEVQALAEGMGDLGLAVWLMRLCGLRPGEALGLQAGDFHLVDSSPTAESTAQTVRADGTGTVKEGVLRVSRQRLASGAMGPLKHRRPGEFRDVPLPVQAARLVTKAREASRATTREALFPDLDRSTVNYRFRKAAKAAGLPGGFRPHDLRHAYASACLSSGVAISDLSHWLGHRSIAVTFGLYSHMTRPALEAGRVALEGHYARWAA